MGHKFIYTIILVIEYGKMERLKYIDNIKGFGILLVIFGHIFFFLTNREIFQSDKLIGFIVSFYMEMFFFFSGFVYVYREDGLWAFVKKSFIALIYPCLILWSIGLLGNLSISLLCGGSISFPDVHEIFWFYWFCKCLFICRIILFLFCRCSFWIYGKFSRGFYFSLIVLGLLSTIVFDLAVDYIPLLCVDRFLMFYIGGYIVGRAKIAEIIIKKRYPLVMILIIALIPFTYNLCSDYLWLDIKVNRLFIGWIMMPIILIIFFSTPFLNFLGKAGYHSLLIYLIHLVLLGFIQTAVSAMYGEVFLNSYMLAVLLSILLLYISLLASVAIKKNPLLRKVVLNK